MTDSSPGVGRVTVSAGGNQIPIAVRDAALRLVHEGLAGESFPLRAGVYLVHALLPDGTGTQKRLSVEPGSKVGIDLGHQISETDMPSSTGVSLEAPDILATVFQRALEVLAEHVTGIGHEKPKDSQKRSRTRARQRRAALPSWAIRLGSFGVGDVGSFQWEDSLDPRVEESTDSIVVRVPVRARAISVVQIVRREHVPLNIVLPASSADRGEANLVATRRSGRYRFAAFPLDSRVSVAARFLSTGEADEGAKVIGADYAASLLQSKMADPIGAAVGAYLLLRIGDLKAMRNWAANLADRFPWFPDGAIAEGERLIRSGDVESGVKRFVEAAKRGLPVFTEGYSLIVSRLRQFAGDEYGDLGSSTRAESKIHLSDLGRWAPYVELAASTLTFTAADPTDPVRSQTPLGRGVSTFRFARTPEGLVAR